MTEHLQTLALLVIGIVMAIDLRTSKRRAEILRLHTEMLTVQNDLNTHLNNGQKITNERLKKLEAALGKS